MDAAVLIGGGSNTRSESVNRVKHFLTCRTTPNAGGEVGVGLVCFGAVLWARRRAMIRMLYGGVGPHILVTSSCVMGVTLRAAACEYDAGGVPRFSQRLDFPSPGTKPMKKV